jgi:3-oxoacyl-[acyl-carrier-protein] synthase II
MLACHVTIIHDCQGPSNTLTCGESSGALSIGESMRVIRRGDADACLSGGGESKVSYMGLIRQTFANRLAAVAVGADGIAAVRPFDPRATGTVLGEGGAILITEGFDSAQSRGVKVFAELAGFAASQCS